MGLFLSPAPVSQSHARAGLLESSHHLRCSSRSIHRKTTKEQAPRRHSSQGVRPQALAFGGLAPAHHNLQTELEALERSQGIPQQVHFFL